MSEAKITEATQFLATASSPQERRLACTLLAESSDLLWARFLRSRAHLVMRGGEEALIQQALWEPEESPIRSAVESYLSRQPASRPILRPMRGTRPSASTDACLVTLEPVVLGGHPNPASRGHLKTGQ